jgi:hypothetical protein
MGNGFAAKRRIAIFVYIDGILLTIFNGERLYSCLQTIWNPCPWWFGNSPSAGWRKLHMEDSHLCFSGITIIFNEVIRGAGMQHAWEA